MNLHEVPGCPQDVRALKDLLSFKTLGLPVSKLPSHTEVKYIPLAKIFKRIPTYNGDFQGNASMFHNVNQVLTRSKWIF